MRATIIGRFLLSLLLLGGMLAVTFPAGPDSTIAAAQGKSDEKKKENPSDKDDKEKKDKKDKQKDTGAAITASADYVVEVECDYDEGAGTTTCTFTAVAPEGAKKIVEFDLPQDAVCAEVVGGEYKYVDPDPNTNVTGYQSKGNTDVITLVLDGEVTVEGTTTFWMKAANEVFPVTAPGLGCTGAATFTLQVTPGSAQPTPEPTATEVPTTGELVVLVYTCADVPEDTTDYDWFRLCNSEGGVHGLELAPVSEVAVDPVTMETDASGDATFADLEPGLYSLKPAGTTWCKAVSDNVDAEGNVIIEAGARTTVYTFVCEGKPAS